MIKRQARKASLLTSTCCHTFPETGITTLLENGGTIENPETIAGHESPRNTKLYDPTDDAMMQLPWMKLKGSGFEMVLASVTVDFLPATECNVPAF